MSDLVLGKNVTVSMLIAGIYQPLFCAKSMAFSYVQEVIESTTITSGFDKEYEVGMGSATLTLTGITKTSDLNKIGPFYLFQQSVRRQKQVIQISFSDQDGNIKLLTFNAIITKNDFSGQAASWAECGIDFQITGPVDIGSTIPTPGGGGGSGGSGGGGGSAGSPNMTWLSDWWQTIAANNFISGLSSGVTDGTQYLLMTTDDIFIVFVEGTQYNIVNGTPTVGQKECELDLVNHKIIFPSDLVFDGSQRVTVVWERPI